MKKTTVPLSRAPRLLEPQPLLLVTAQRRDAINVATIAWACNVSREPPLVGFALHPSRWTYELILESEVFVLNIPDAEYLRHTAYCGSVSGRDQDKFAACGFHTAIGTRVECPIIEECIAHLECGLVDIWQRDSDHAFLIGEVLAASVVEGYFDEVWKLPAEVQLIHHYGGPHYARLGPPETLAD